MKKIFLLICINGLINFSHGFDSVKQSQIKSASSCNAMELSSVIYLVDDAAMQKKMGEDDVENHYKLLMVKHANDLEHNYVLLQKLNQDEIYKEAFTARELGSDPNIYKKLNVHKISVQTAVDNYATIVLNMQQKIQESQSDMKVFIDLHMSKVNSIFKMINNCTLDNKNFSDLFVYVKDLYSACKRLVDNMNNCVQAMRRNVSAIITYAISRDCIYHNYHYNYDNYNTDNLHRHHLKSELGDKFDVIYHKYSSINLPCDFTSDTEFSTICNLYNLMTDYSTTNLIANLSDFKF